MRLMSWQYMSDDTQTPVNEERYWIRLTLAPPFSSVMITWPLNVCSTSNQLQQAAEGVVYDVICHKMHTNGFKGVQRWYMSGLGVSKQVVCLILTMFILKLYQKAIN